MKRFSHVMTSLKLKYNKGLVTDNLWWFVSTASKCSLYINAPLCCYDNFILSVSNRELDMHNSLKVKVWLSYFLLHDITYANNIYYVVH